MKVDVLDLKGQKVREFDLPAALFEAPVNIDLMHQAYTRQMANARLGTHQTKVRGEVRGGGRKPFKQKGTGRARTGSTNAAQWVGGGRIHTPHPRSYEQSMPKKMRRPHFVLHYPPRLQMQVLWLWMDLILQKPRPALWLKH